MKVNNNPHKHAVNSVGTFIEVCEVNLFLTVSMAVIQIQRMGVVDYNESLWKIPIKD